MLDSFSIIFTLSAMASFVWLGWAPSDFARRVETPGRLMAAGLAALLGGLLGARLMFVVLHWSYFQSHALEIFFLWSGGLSGFGGVIGGVVGCWVYTRTISAGFWRVADALARPATVTSASVWAGCWLIGCAYGQPVEWGFVQPDIFGRQAARWPAALLAALITAGWALCLPWLEKKLTDRPSGWISSLTLAWLGLSMLAASLLRADPTILYGGIRQETWGSVIVIALASTALTNRRGTM